MSEDPAYSRAVSLHLSRTLDEIGINTLTVRRRRHAFVFDENISTIGNNLIGRKFSIFNFGSQTEGTTTPGMNSDLDKLYCYYKWNIIDDWSEWKQGENNMLMLHENTASGYCRLQVLRSDVPMALENLPDGDFTYDDRGRVLMKNTLPHSDTHGVPRTRNGPARSWRMRAGSNIDNVHAVPCSTWPGQAGEFTRRHSRHGWPTERILQQAVQKGVFLVPVGFKLSPTESLEWRISASLPERCLMFSLTIIHLKCYVVLKLLAKTFVEPHIGKCISSYHCKTAVLYCTETSERGFWRDDNLLQCVQRCLAMLLTWVTDGFCPQFIMPKENLFAGKVTPQNRDTLQSIFTRLMKSNGRALLCVSTDNFGHKLQARLSAEPSTVPVLDSLETIKLIGEIDRHVHGCIHDNVSIILLDEINASPVATARSVHQKIRKLRDRIREADTMERQATQGYIETLSCWLGSLLASVALSRKVRIPKVSLRLIHTAAKSDIASNLKLASVFYCSGELRKVETMLQNIEAHFCRNEIQPNCVCYNQGFTMSMAFRLMTFALKSKRKRAELFAHCVRFTPQETHCAPPAMRNELCKSDGDDASSRRPLFDDWMDLAAVDCQPYLYYLQFITFRQLGKRGIQKDALSNLERCIRGNGNFGHHETSWNLLGQCKEMEQEPEAAMACYRTSLEIRPRNNAANWHLQNLRYTAIRNSV